MVYEVQQMESLPSNHLKDPSQHSRLRKAIFKMAGIFKIDMVAAPRRARSELASSPLMPSAYRRAALPSIAAETELRLADNSCSTVGPVVKVCELRRMQCELNFLPH